MVVWRPGRAVVGDRDQASAEAGRQRWYQVDPAIGVDKDSFVDGAIAEHVRALQQRLNQRIKPALALLGLLPTRYRSGKAHAQEGLAEIQQQVEALHVPLRFAPIRLAVAAADAPAHGMALADFAPTAPIAQEYRRTAEQLLTFLEDQR
jgi:cellulose biosynthesis protein BcsQ